MTETGHVSTVAFTSVFVTGMDEDSSSELRQTKPTTVAAAEQRATSRLRFLTIVSFPQLFFSLFIERKQGRFSALLCFIRVLLDPLCHLQLNNDHILERIKTSLLFRIQL